MCQRCLQSRVLQTDSQCHWHPFTELVWALEEPCSSCLCCTISSQYPINTALFTHSFYRYRLKQISLEATCWHAYSKQDSSRVSELQFRKILAVSLSHLNLQKNLGLTLVQLIHATRWQITCEVSSLFQQNQFIGPCISGDPVGCRKAT